MKQLWSRSKIPFMVWKAENGKTDADFAAVCRVHVVTVSKWINGKVPVPFAVAKLLAETLDKSIHDLFEERNSRAPRSRSDRQADVITASLLAAPAKHQHTA